MKLEGLDPRVKSMFVVTFVVFFLNLRNYKVITPSTMFSTSNWYCSSTCVSNVASTSLHVTSTVAPLHSIHSHTPSQKTSPIIPPPDIISPISHLPHIYLCIQKTISTIIHFFIVLAAKCNFCFFTHIYYGGFSHWKREIS